VDVAIVTRGARGLDEARPEAAFLESHVGAHCGGGYRRKQLAVDD
jgi:hypothetical protein